MYNCEFMLKLSRKSSRKVTSAMLLPMEIFFQIVKSDKCSTSLKMGTPYFNKLTLSNVNNDGELFYINLSNEFFQKIIAVQSSVQHIHFIQCHIKSTDPSVTQFVVDV